MTVGEYAGVPLQDPTDTWQHGAVFLLRKPPSRTQSVSLHGWTTTVLREIAVLITCGPSLTSSFDATFEAALQMANVALDSMSAQGLADCVIRKATSDCLVWWPENQAGGVVMRLKNTAEALPISIGSAPPHVALPPTPTPAIHDTYRFIRMFRTSDDLYDAYRNLFLAFECLLSDIRPSQQLPNGRWEGEKHWFMDALSQADQLAPLADLTPPGTQDHKAWIYTNIYQAQRSGLMHAKRGRGYLLPQDGTNRTQLIASSRELWSYIRKLIKAHLGGRFSTSYVVDGARGAVAQSQLRSHVVVVSDDAKSANPLDVNWLSEDAATVELQSDQPTRSTDDPGYWTLLAHCDAADLNALATIVLPSAVSSSARRN